MKFSAHDLKTLRLPIAACIGLIGAGVACYFFADIQVSESTSARNSAAAQRKEVQTKLSRATDEEREIRMHLQQYKAIAERGIIGDEKRLDWIDTIAAIKNERQLFGISYDLDVQKPLDYPGFSGGGADFMVSRLKVDMQLLHEQDLLHFVDDLAKRGKAYLSVRTCSVTRLGRTAVPGTSLAPRLSAQCTFDMITIRSKPA